MIALDANILVYAHRGEANWHEAAVGVVKDLAESGRSWAIPWPCIHEFLAIVTNPKIYRPASTLAQAIEQVEIWMESPELVLIGEGPAYWNEFTGLAALARVSSGVVHDARVAAICRVNGVKELWTADRDFGRFPQQKVRNPLI